MTARRTRRERAVLGTLAALLALGALGVVFAAYLNPHFAVDLANLVWACF